MGREWGGRVGRESGEGELRVRYIGSHMSTRTRMSSQSVENAQFTYL